MHKNAYVRIAVLLLTALLFSGCASKTAAPAHDRRASLPDDPAFVQALARSQTRGLSGIRIVAPASGIKDADAERAHALARKLGVNFPQEAIDNSQVPYNANSDAVRLKLLTDALKDPDTEVIWAARGGYGASRLLPGLASVRPLTKKIFIGYSDMTFLHLYFQKLGWRTVHGSMFWELDNPHKDERNFRLLASLLSGSEKELFYDGITPFNAAARDLPEPIRAPMTGGNLTCLAAAAGTPWPLDAAGKILFLEDVKEPGYKIDRMLTQLQAAGHLAGVRAVILGSFSQGDKFTEYALERFAADCPIPVFKTELFGHGPQNYPLVFNAPALLAKSADATATYSLRIHAAQLP